MEKVKLGDLKSCDVLLFKGTSFVSRMIRLADNGCYSHAALYIGLSDKGVPQIAEMLGGEDSGLKVGNISDRTKNEDVDVYRYYGDDGKVMADGQLVLDHESDYFKKGEAYAYDEILLLSILCITRRINIPFVEPILRHIFDQAADVIASLFKGKKEPMICSEFVYRCFTEAGLLLTIPGADLIISQAKIKDAGALLANDLEAHQASLLQNYFAARSTLSLPIQAVATFVTPNDLARSPNLQKLGQLG